ncbi:XAC2610-related protein [Mucilaginibacter sp. 3215]|uniref:XAC2610-related protein n=1 Tax=Mucilaginibacter sp. 3215 TaxID=3373912 RepID=UPI003D1C6C29
MYEDVFKNCDATRSYITGYRKNAEVSDYDFGDLVIADVNFDELEDIAIKYDSGGNGGPLYNFYLQDKNGHFYLSRYLTDSVGSFPAYINPKQKTITTQIHANVRYEARKTFRYNSKSQKWKLIKWQMID